MRNKTVALSAAGFIVAAFTAIAIMSSVPVPHVPDWRETLTATLYASAFCFTVGFGINLFGLDNPNRESSPVSAGLCWLAATACANAPIVFGLLPTSLVV